jgi:type VI secretion system protein VasI
MHPSIRPLAVLVLVPGFLRAQAAPQGGLARCATITSDLRRLACYDSLARGAAPNPVEAPAVRSDSTGLWQITDRTNPLDNTRTVILVLRATTGTSRSGIPVELTLRCQSGKTEAYVNWSESLGSDEAAVTSRVGRFKSDVQAWSLSSDKEATVVPGNIPQFIQTIASIGSYVVQVTPPNESRITATFDVSGLRVAMRPLRAACGW